MHPAHDFKINFGEPEQDRLRLACPVDLSHTIIELHTDESSVRNICFVWPNGRKAFFNYAYLIAAEFEPNTEQNVIKLDFSSHSVSISGYTLNTLFLALLDHSPRIVTVTDSRYVLANSYTDITVINIIINKNDH